VNVAVCRLTFRLPENGSLKGKRQVLNSIRQRLHNRFNVSVAEIDNNDVWQLATIGIGCVANDAGHAQEVVAKAVAYIEELRLDIEIIEEDTEVVGL
jgi:uncharacterized protein YlxP (DUF503 family)